MEESKKFYENSTKQLVNILECLSSQLSSNNCTTRHCSSDVNIDSDSFDSLLSRRSHDLSTTRPSLDSYQPPVTSSDQYHPGVITVNSSVPDQDVPLYENVLYDSHHTNITNNQSSLGDNPGENNVSCSGELSSSNYPINEIINSFVLAGRYERSDSLSSVFLPPAPSSSSSSNKLILKPSVVKENITRNRSLSS